MSKQWHVVALPALSDNYAFVLGGSTEGSVAIVDPGEARPVLEWLAGEGRRPEVLLLTHHHRDHVGGVPEIVAHFPDVAVVGAERDRPRLPPLSRGVREGDAVNVAGREARVIEIPGHTRAHIAWFLPDGTGGGDLFSGDTVFGGTIGNLFEGTPDDMFASLCKLRDLPGGTRVWCGHEYTLRYVREAARFDPHEPRLAERLRRLEAAGARAIHVPLTLEEECATNPFFRWDDPGLAQRLGTAPGVETFRRLCEIL